MEQGKMGVKGGEGGDGRERADLYFWITMLATLDFATFSSLHSSTSL